EVRQDLAHGASDVLLDGESIERGEPAIDAHEAQLGIELAQADGRRFVDRLDLLELPRDERGALRETGLADAAVDDLRHEIAGRADEGKRALVEAGARAAAEGQRADETAARHERMAGVDREAHLAQDAQR